MPIKINIYEKYPKTYPKTFVIKAVETNFSQPKLYIPKGKDGKPTISRPWYVWFNFRPHGSEKGTKWTKFKFRNKINTYKTVKQRKEFGKSLVRVYTQLLNEGYNPFTQENTKGYRLQKKEYSCNDALLIAFNQKKKELAEKTIGDWKSRLKTFLDYAKKAGFAHININDVTSFHIATFLNYIEDSGQSGKSVNNFRGCLSALWGKLANDMMVHSNPVISLKKRKENPQKNKPFTPKEIKKIKKHLEKTDPGLLTFIRFVAFAFLRPVEVVRLTVGDVDLQNNRLTVKTKTEARATVRIVPQLAKDIESMKTENYAKTNFLLTPSGTPGNWTNQRTGEPTAENTRTKEFSDRFAKVKKHFGFGEEYGIYSFRHSFAVDLYNSFINAGATTIEAEMKMLPITRHKSLSGLRNYLRGVGALMPKDYGENFTLDI